MNYYPSATDDLWNGEVQYVLGYCASGLWADIGAGDRTLYPHMITVDNFSDCDIKAEADYLPFKDSELDGIYSSHTLEHTKDILKTIKEWLRCVEIGGYVIIICPDKRFIPTKGTLEADPQHKWDLQYEELREIIKLLDNAEQINKNIWALPNWSFLMILRKIK